MFKNHNDGMGITRNTYEISYDQERYCKMTLLLNLTHYNIYLTGLLITDGVRIYTDLLMNSF